MKRKKLFALLIATTMLLSMTACGSDTSDSSTENSTVSSQNAAENNESSESKEVPESLTIEHVYGTAEVPYAPERVCVLDANTVDIIHTLGLGENITTVKSGKNTPTYLSEYYESDSIVVIQGSKNKNKNNNGTTEANTEGENRDNANAEGENRDNANAEGESRDNANAEKENQNNGNEQATEETDPYEAYYSIDADLIIGTSGTINEELYAILEEIAPTVVLPEAMENTASIYDGVKENARTVASVWGAEDTLESLISEYDTTYQQLCDKLNGNKLLLMSTSFEQGRIQLEFTEQEDHGEMEVNEFATIFEQMGADLVAETASEDIVVAAKYEKGAEADVVVERAKIIADWINETEFDSIVFADRAYDDMESAKADGCAIPDFESIIEANSDKVHQISNSAKTGINGLQGIFLFMDELKAAFLG